MHASARNRLEGTISSVIPGSVNSEVVLGLPGGGQLAAIVPSELVRALGLTVGQRAVALVNAALVTLVTEAGRHRFTARNQYLGQVTDVTPGAVCSEVTLRLSCGHPFTAVVTNAAVVDLQLKAGKYATVLFNASQVIIGVANGVGH
jgi:molybdate transport system regulatory protein